MKLVMQHDHRALQRDGKTVRVEETDSHWIIPDTILTTDGVMNGARKKREDLAQTWQLAEGRAVPHDHPGTDEYGLVIDQRRIAGFVTNVRYTDATGDVIADVYIAKAPAPGLMVTEENIARSRQTMAALAAGEPIDLSIGFWSTDEYLLQPMTYDGPNEEFAGQEYDRIQHQIIYDHVAIVPVGACGERCRLGSAQVSDHAHALKERALQTNKDRENMANPNQDCADKEQILDRLAKAEKRATDAEQANATRDSVIKALQDQLASLKNAQDAQNKQRVDSKRDELARLLAPVGADTARVAAELAKIPTETPEGVLDTWIAREKQFRGVSDRSRFSIENAPAPAAAKNGIVRTEYGFAAVDMNAASKASRDRSVN